MLIGFVIVAFLGGCIGFVVSRRVTRSKVNKFLKELDHPFSSAKTRYYVREIGKVL